jgi:hypothetical protein
MYRRRHVREGTTTAIGERQERQKTTSLQYAGGGHVRIFDRGIAVEILLEVDVGND